MLSEAVHVELEEATSGARGGLESVAQKLGKGSNRVRGVTGKLCARVIWEWRRDGRELFEEAFNGARELFSVFEQLRERYGVKWSWGCALGRGKSSHVL